MGLGIGSKVSYFDGWSCLQQEPWRDQWSVGVCLPSRSIGMGKVWRYGVVYLKRIRMGKEFILDIFV